MSASPTVTVLLPTRNRVDLLKEALHSVRKQTAAHRIKEVVVSENGGNKKSERVLKDFGDLPLRYQFRNPILGGLEHHAELLCREENSEYCAILHDDDWWTPDHLENATQALDETHNAVAFIGAFHRLLFDRSELTTGYIHRAIWFAIGCKTLDQSQWMITFPDLAVASFLVPPAHFSGMLVRRFAVRQAMPVVVATGNQLDIDRMLPLALSLSGAIIYNPIPSVVVRMHAGQDQATFSDETKRQRMLETTEWISNLCKRNRIDLEEQILKRLRQLPPQARDKMNWWFAAPWCVPTGRRLARAARDSDEWIPEPWRRNTRIQKLVRNVTPPLLFHAWGLVKRKINK